MVFLAFLPSFITTITPENRFSGVIVLILNIIILKNNYSVFKGGTHLMKYLPLAKYKYVSSDPAAIENEYQNRLNGYTSQQTTLFPLLNYKDGTQSSKYPIFFLPLPVIQNLADQLRRNSNAIKSISATLPQVAINQFLNSLLLSEIFYTNDIEGVKTSRIEISTVIQENNQQVNGRLQEITWTNLVT